MRGRPHGRQPRERAVLAAEVMAVVVSVRPGGDSENPRMDLLLFRLVAKVPPRLRSIPDLMRHYQQVRQTTGDVGLSVRVSYTHQHSGFDAALPAGKTDNR